MSEGRKLQRRGATLEKAWSPKLWRLEGGTRWMIYGHERAIRAGDDQTDRREQD